MTPVSSREALSPQRAGVLDLLRGQPHPVTVNELSVATGLHANTVREHLDALVSIGLAVRERAPARGRGRPAWRYASSRRQPVQPAVVREYAGLAGALAAQIARTSSDPRRDAVQAGEAWGAVLAGESPAGGQDPEASRRRILALLAEIGFAPRVAAGGGSVQLRQCPYLDVAQQYPEIICTVHLGVVRGMLGATGGEPERVRLSPFAEPGACRLELAEPPA